MSEFLDGEELAERIRCVVGGSDVKCAVAFWGNNDFIDTSGDHSKWKIICDLSKGATSPEALGKLGAPNNVNLKHISGLHSKVYISDRGVVIGSANASARALGFDGGPVTLVEAGTFHENSSDIWESASDWFAGKFEGAKVVDQNAIREARCRYRAPVKAIDRGLTELTFIEQIASASDWYASKGIGFVITTRRTTADEREAAARQTLNAMPEMRNNRKLNKEEDRAFTNWGDLESLMSKFVEFYLGPRGGHEIVTHDVIIKDIKHGHFYTRKPAQDIIPAGVNNIPRRLDQRDCEILRAISHKNNDEGKIFTAASFSDALQQAYAERKGNQQPLRGTH